MDREVFWVLLSMIVILGAMVIAVAVLAMQDRQEEESVSTASAWRVELWNILRGNRLELRFENYCIVGRSSIAATNGGMYPPELDQTVSREHCMLYEQDGMLLIWNLSAVNPTVLNGYRINTPQRIVPGDRIELGNSVFLVTSVERL